MTVLFFFKVLAQAMFEMSVKKEIRNRVLVFIDVTLTCDVSREYRVKCLEPSAMKVADL